MAGVGALARQGFDLKRAVTSMRDGPQALASVELELVNITGVSMGKYQANCRTVLRL